jgi:S1-C subfamily serine protease
VVAVDGEPITGQAALVATIRNLSPGSRVQVSLVRAGKPLEVTAVLDQRPPNP